MSKTGVTIGILACGTNRAQWLDAHGDFADWFKPFLLNAADRQVSFKVYRAHLDELPNDADEADAWLITGSPVSVYEELAWQTALIKFLHSTIPCKPVIGVCYGHQLLHHMLGGKVEKSLSWGIGAHTYDVIKHPSWLCHGDNSDPQQFTLLASHQDQVTSLAPDSTLLATSTFCPNAVTQIGASVLTVQAHPELTKSLMSEVCEFRREQQGTVLTDQALTSLSNPVNDKEFGQWIFSFIDHVHAQENAEAIAS